MSHEAGVDKIFQCHGQSGAENKIAFGKNRRAVSKIEKQQEISTRIKGEQSIVIELRENVSAQNRILAHGIDADFRKGLWSEIDAVTSAENIRVGSGLQVLIDQQAPARSDGQP